VERKGNSEKNKGNTRGDVKRIDGLDVQWAIYYFNEEAWFDRWISSRLQDAVTRKEGWSITGAEIRIYVNCL